jgi:hypothetical protein
VVAFFRWAETHYRTPQGEPTTEIGELRRSLGPLTELYGFTLAAEFGPRPGRRAAAGRGAAGGVVICRYLRASRPGEFSPDPAEYDFPELPDEARWRLNAQRGTGPFDMQAAAACRVANPHLPPVGEYAPADALTHARAQARVWAEAMRAAANLIADLEEPVGGHDAPMFEAAEDYSWVKWSSGAIFIFTPTMRPAVRRLCEDALHKVPTSKNALLDATRRDRATGVRELFKMKGGTMATAWGTMIVRAEGSRDVYTIRDPGPSPNR